MRLPVIEGMIRRRILVNYRVDPGVIAQMLPTPFRPKLHAGYAVAGICLIRLEHIRPQKWPQFFGMHSENAAHRVAVLWDEKGIEREGVFISRRDTNSRLNHWLGGRFFPGEHQRASFEVSERGSHLAMFVRSRDRAVDVAVQGRLADALPRASIFSSLDDASSFFASGSVGYSVTQDPNRLDGIELRTRDWQVRPLSVRHVHSSYFDDERKFPRGTAQFDHALAMKDVRHEWHAAPDFCI